MRTKYFGLIIGFLLISEVHAQQIVSGEYFFDTAPASGAGTAFTVSTSTDVNESLTISTVGLSAGIHQLYVRVKNDMGIWSHYEGRMIYVLEPLNLISTTLVTGEWFIDSDPGTGNGTPLSFTAGANVNASLSIPNVLSPGIHHLYIRVKNDLGVWSHYEGRMFYVLEPLSTTNTNITSGEWFLDSDPGTGNGTAISFAAGTTVQPTISIPTTALAPGFHNLFIRVKDDLGKWSHYEGRLFYIIQPEPALAEQIESGEWFVDTDPGIGNATFFSLTAGADINEAILLNTTGVADGFHYLFVRVKENNGTWSHYEGKRFLVCGTVMVPPTVSGMSSVCENTDLSLSGSTVALATSYFWKNPSGIIQSGNNLLVPTISAAEAGTYRFYAVRSGGTDCDTVISEIEVTVKPVYQSNNPQTICDGQSYDINGNSYTLPGIYNDTLVTLSGCDSIIVTQLNVIPAQFTSNPQSICDGASYSFNGNAYSLAGTYNDTLTGMNGCDSIIVTSLSVNPNYVVTNPQTICQGQSYAIGGSTYTVSGTYTDLLQSVSGCDSLVTTGLTVNPLLTGTNPQTICQGQSYSIGSSSYTTAGTYSDMLQTAGGCDSLVSTVLTVIPVLSSTNPQTICQGTAYVIGSSSYTLAGTYTDVLSSLTGCDSTVTTVLTVNATSSTNNPQSICQGDSYLIGANSYTLSGTYSDVFTNINGCDSTIVTQLTVNPVFTVSNPQTICLGESYTISTSTYTTGGNYTDVFSSVTGCDSTINTILTVNSIVLNMTVSISGTGQTITANESNASYQWIDCVTNSQINGEQGQSFTAVDNGEYAVILTSFVCGISDTTQCTVVDNISVDETQAWLPVRIYPNPTADYFMIENTALIGKLVLRDNKGRIVMQQDVSTQQYKLDVSELSKGIYLLELQYKGQSVYRKLSKL